VKAGRERAQRVSVACIERRGRLADQAESLGAQVHCLSVRQWGTVPRGKVQVVLNGIDTSVYRDASRREEIRRSLAIPAEARVIGTVGRLNEVKRQDLLVRAFAEISRRRAEAWLLVVGDGPERSRLEELARELGVAERAVFAGYQANPEWFFAAMDAFALTSRHEGLPLALLEAWAAGLPVVSSAVGGIPKVVEHGRTGLLFESGDEAALVQALEQVLDDAALAERLAAAGREVAEARYSLSRMADDYSRIYTEAMAAR
jgi:glycosyltransferase involved in cell wall biosynthesis